jgi:hypothetical protein
MPDLQQIIKFIVDHATLHALGLEIMLGVGYAVNYAYQRIRQPGWADTPGNIQVPYGGLIVVAMIAVVVVYLAIVISRDPLAPHG